MRLQPLDQLAIALLRWHIGVHQTHTQLQRLAIRQVRFDEFRPFRADGAGDFRVAVAGKIG